MKRFDSQLKERIYKKSDNNNIVIYLLLNNK